MTSTARLGLTLLISATATAATPSFAAYTFTLFDTPGSTNTQLWDVNDAGQIVGNDDFGGFIYSGGSYTYLTMPDGARVSATGISNSGVIVGGTGTNGFIYSGGSYTAFTVPSATQTLIRHISSDGRYLAGSYSTDAIISGGFTYDRQTSALTLLPQASPTALVIMQGVNTAGIATGSQTGTGNAALNGGLLYNVNSGTSTLYTTAAGLNAPRFRDINDAGLVTGFVNNSALGVNVGFVGTPGGAFETFAIPGATLTAGYGLNNRGLLVGYYTDASSNLHSFIATAVPEPTSALLLVAGLVWVTTRRRQLI
jgi:hypothetical protein